MKCLQCDRALPMDKLQGEVEVGGNMLCLGCGNVMIWKEDLTLREMTEKERLEASGNFELMRARAKVASIPNGVRFPGSWLMALLFCFIVAMVVLERVGVVPLLHPPQHQGQNHGRH